MSRAVFPPCYLTWDQTMVGVSKIMTTSFKRSCACAVVFSDPDHAAGRCHPVPLLETPGHSQASLGSSPGVTAPFSWVLICTGLFVPSKRHIMSMFTLAISCLTTSNVPWFISLLTKVCLVKPRVSTVVMYRCESWTLKNTERQRIDAFELWYWRRLLRVPSTERWANQSILKEISPEYSLERLMMKLKLQSFGYLMQWTDSLANILMLGKIEDRRRRGWQRVRWLDGIIDLMDMKLS